MSNLISIMAETVNRLATTSRATVTSSIKNTITDAVEATGLTGILGSGSVRATDRASSAVVVDGSDMRVRLKAQVPDLYGDGIMAILKETNGLLFPYTPSIQVSQDVNYTEMAMTHANTNYHNYTNTPNVTIGITGKFTVQNQREGRYALAALHFLRTMSKMYFGETDARAGKAGLPPPVLLLSGYGTYVFNNIRVILKSHSYSFEDAVDMVPVTLSSGSARLPALFTVTLSLTVQQTPQAMRKSFSLDAFRSGALLEDGGWI